MVLLWPGDLTNSIIKTKTKIIIIRWFNIILVSLITWFKMIIMTNVPAASYSLYVAYRGKCITRIYACYRIRIVMLGIMIFFLHYSRTWLLVWCNFIKHLVILSITHVKQRALCKH